jgi:hypothetical protein
MVLDVHSSIRLPHSYLFLDGGEKLLHPRFRREVCAAPCRTRRYPVAGGRDTTRYDIFMQRILSILTINATEVAAQGKR